MKYSDAIPSIPISAYFTAVPTSLSAPSSYTPRLAHHQARKQSLARARKAMATTQAVPTRRRVNSTDNLSKSLASTLSIRSPIKPRHTRYTKEEETTPMLSSDDEREPRKESLSKRLVRVFIIPVKRSPGISSSVGKSEVDFRKHRRNAVVFGDSRTHPYLQIREHRPVELKSFSSTSPISPPSRVSKYVSIAKAARPSFPFSNMRQTKSPITSSRSSTSSYDADMSPVDEWDFSCRGSESLLGKRRFGFDGRLEDCEAKSVGRRRVGMSKMEKLRLRLR